MAATHLSHQGPPPPPSGVGRGKRCKSAKTYALMRASALAVHITGGLTIHVNVYGPRPMGPRVPRFSEREAQAKNLL